jgi:hypothetical protein
MPGSPRKCGAEAERKPCERSGCHCPPKRRESPDDASPNASTPIARSERARTVDWTRSDRGRAEGRALHHVDVELGRTSREGPIADAGELRGGKGLDPAFHETQALRGQHAARVLSEIAVDQARGCLP